MTIDTSVSHSVMSDSLAQIQRICLQCRRYRKNGFNPYVGKIPWRKKWQSNLVLWPGKAHGRRSHQTTVYGVPKSQTQLSEHACIYTHTHTHTHAYTHTCTHIHIHTHTHIYTHTHTHIHTYTHTHTYTYTMEYCSAKKD